MSPKAPSSRVAGHLMSTQRIASLDDAVFAIVMTILVLELHVPWGLEPEFLLDGILAQWPVLISYVVSFINLGIFWVGMYYQYHYIKKVDRIFLWINIFFLMFVSLIPFSTSLLGAYPQSLLPSVVYGLNLLIIGSLSSLQWRYVTAREKLTNDDLTPTAKEHVRKRLLVLPGMSLIAIILSFVSLRLSLLIYILLPLYYMWPKHVEAWFKKALRGSRE